ncbi:hypothetical protein WN55_07264 [Dufourea novaeangliae]|uniref:Uncharacterized protein n=1 Tax=Dufourea novaeangliae TaxID=178035 RepID=A0A154PT71_DUFNO|nr:hypothetical protein WN55_07264 [Dufourea novaeangliae]
MTSVPWSFLHPINTQKPHKLTVPSASGPSTCAPKILVKAPSSSLSGGSRVEERQKLLTLAASCGGYAPQGLLRLASVHKPPLIELNKENTPGQITA